LGRIYFALDLATQEFEQWLGFFHAEILMFSLRDTVLPEVNVQRRLELVPSENIFHAMKRATIDRYERAAGGRKRYERTHVAADPSNARHFSASATI
jgi:hypothetical protein